MNNDFPSVTPRAVSAEDTLSAIASQSDPAVLSREVLLRAPDPASLRLDVLSALIALVPRFGAGFGRVVAAPEKVAASLRNVLAFLEQIPAEDLSAVNESGFSALSFLLSPDQMCGSGVADGSVYRPGGDLALYLLGRGADPFLSCSFVPDSKGEGVNVWAWPVYRALLRDDFPGVAEAFLFHPSSESPHARQVVKVMCERGAWVQKSLVDRAHSDPRELRVLSRLFDLGAPKDHVENDLDLLGHVRDVTVLRELLKMGVRPHPAAQSAVLVWARRRLPDLQAMRDLLVEACPDVDPSGVRGSELAPLLTDLNAGRVRRMFPSRTVSGFSGRYPYAVPSVIASSLPRVSHSFPGQLPGPYAKLLSHKHFSSPNVKMIQWLTGQDLDPADRMILSSLRALLQEVRVPERGEATPAQLAWQDLASQLPESPSDVSDSDVSKYVERLSLIRRVGVAGVLGDVGPDASVGDVSYPREPGSFANFPAETSSLGFLPPPSGLSVSQLDQVLAFWTREIFLEDPPRISKEGLWGSGQENVLAGLDNRFGHIRSMSALDGLVRWEFSKCPDPASWSADQAGRFVVWASSFPFRGRLSVDREICPVAGPFQLSSAESLSDFIRSHSSVIQSRLGPSLPEWCRVPEVGPNFDPARQGFMVDGSPLMPFRVDQVVLPLSEVRMWAGVALSGLRQAPRPGSSLSALASMPGDGSMPRTVSGLRSPPKS